MPPHPHSNPETADDEDLVTNRVHLLPAATSLPEAKIVSNDEQVEPYPNKDINCIFLLFMLAFRHDRRSEYAPALGTFHNAR